MTGRGIDQILPHPGEPRLFEPYVRSALEYVALAEQVSGLPPRPVATAYIWGDALAELQRRQPDVRIINLETAITAGGDADPGKGIHYRMHPDNIDCLRVAGIDCCCLANNHVLDWGVAGLRDTLAALHAAGIRTTGAGSTLQSAAAPALLTAPRARVAVFAFGIGNSGIPRSWAATPSAAGVNWLPDLSAGSLQAAAQCIAEHRAGAQIVIASLHWGGNWGYAIQADERAFAHGLIDGAGVDIVHGHSSHHPRGIEIHRGHAIFYGCGDLLNDYEGIGGHERFRGELGLMYFVTVAVANGTLVRLSMVPTRMRRLQLTLASGADARWTQAMLDRECRNLGAGVHWAPDGSLTLAPSDDQVSR